MSNLLRQSQYDDFKFSPNKRSIRSLTLGMHASPSLGLRTKTALRFPFTFNPLYSDVFSHTDISNNDGIVHYIFYSVTSQHSLSMVLTLTNSEDYDVMQHHAAFHLGLTCLGVSSKGLLNW